MVSSLYSSEILLKYSPANILWQVLTNLIWQGMACATLKEIMPLVPSREESLVAHGNHACAMLGVLYADSDRWHTAILNSTHVCIGMTQWLYKSKYIL